MVDMGTGSALTAELGSAFAPQVDTASKSRLAANRTQFFMF
jgi:hypothetical protein